LVPSSIDTLRLSEAGKVAWRKELSYHTEAAVCALIFAAVPNLQTLELYAQPLSVDYPNNPTQYGSDVLRLAQGLAITKITSLMLSNNLNGLHAARLPTLTNLTLDYPFAIVSKGCFPNVTALKIQGQSQYMLVGVPEKLRILYRDLPNLRSLEFNSGKSVVPAPQVETLIFRPAEWNALAWICGFLIMRKHSTDAMALKRIEVHWCADNLRPVARVGMERLAQDAGIQVVVFWCGELARVYAEGK
jgi:hypothetical protein